ncbi:MAG: hypothetical protein DRP66_09310 [Planctomycetota bacterium]|nr:MAG: hypothetical protein DRP66_09310 [Planctomycetota bacterium]
MHSTAAASVGPGRVAGSDALLPEDFLSLPTKNLFDPGARMAYNHCLGFLPGPTAGRQRKRSRKV